MDWTTEQILGLAPDQFTLRAGRGVAEPERWIALHQAGSALWGIFPDGSQKTGETAVFLPTFSFTCTCNSRKSPCRHSLGLLLLWQEQTKRFTPHPPLRQLAAWVQREQLKHNRSGAPNGRTPAAPSPKLTQLQTGLYELELWLLDLMRHGLASLPERPKAYWEAMAHRLVDAQAALLVQELRSLANVPTAQSNWPDDYLRRLGRLYLIIQGFRHFDQLPLTTQADLQTAVGWLPQTNETATTVTDNWLVLGRQQENVGSQTRYLTWLWGQESQKIAQLIDLGPSARPEGQTLPTHSFWHGSLNFLPSNWPLMAQRQGSFSAQPTAVTPKCYPTIRAAAQAYSQALSVNPWLCAFPMLLHNTLPSQTEAGWQLGDAAGTCLPLPEKFSHGWHLTALAAGTPSLTVFGVWNGRCLHPLSVHRNNQWHDIHIWRGAR